MPAGFKGLITISKSRLSRRIVLWVFVCVIAIETIIFIPSYNNRKKELLSHLKDVSLAMITAVCTFNTSRVDLEPGDILIGYTDGITEALSSDGKLFTSIDWNPYWSNLSHQPLIC